MAEETTSPYLDFVEGVQIAYAKDISWERTLKGDVEIKVIFASEPSSVNAMAPYTTHRLRTASTAQSQYVRMMKDKEMINILFPLADLEDVGTKVKLSEVVQKAKENLMTADFKCEINVKKRSGGVSQKTGEEIFYSDITALKALEAIEKVPYESTIEYDLDQLPF